MNLIEGPIFLDYFFKNNLKKQFYETALLFYLKFSIINII